MKSKKIISLTLAICMLLLTACTVGGEAQQTSETRGRYIETDISPPIEGRFTSFLKPDGTIVCFSVGLRKRAESSDGGYTWTTSEGPGANTDRFEFIRFLSMLPDGNLLAFDHEVGIIKIMPDGETIPYSVDDIDRAIADGDMVMMSLMQVLGNDRLILHYNIISMDSGGMIQHHIGGSSIDADDNTADIDSDINNDINNDIDSDINNDINNYADGDINDDYDSDSYTSNDDEITDDDAEVSGTTEINFGVGFSDGFTPPKAVLLDLETGALIAELPLEGTFTVTSDENYIYIMDIIGNIMKFNLYDGSTVSDSGISFANSDIAAMSSNAFPAVNVFDFASGGTLAVNPDGGLYSVQNGNLLFADTSGAVSVVLNSTEYSLGTPRTSISSLFVLPDGNIVVNLSVGGANRLYKYVWDEYAEFDPNKVISIWSLEDNTLVRAAITEFRKANPSATINLEIALSGNDAMSVSDAIRTLNTRLLSGNGPDILILDGTPAESYAARGMLLDINSLIDTSDIFDNLLEPFVTDGKLYFLPTQMFIPALIGNEEALSKINTIDDLVEIVVSGNDLPISSGDFGSFRLDLPPDERPALNFTDINELHDVMWAANAPAIISDNRLNTDALRQHMEALKAISDKYGLGADTPDEFSSMGMMTVVGTTGGDGESMIMTGSLMNYAMGMADYGALIASNLMVLQMIFGRDDSLLALFPGLTQGAWNPSTKVGINASTTNPELAAAFVDVMLSIDVQRLNYGTGLPITRAGIRAQENALIELFSELGSAREMEITINIDVEDLIEQLRTPSMTDKVLKDMLWENIERFIRGELDIEGAVRAVEQSVRNYLAEREV